MALVESLLYYMKKTFIWCKILSAIIANILLTACLKISRLSSVFLGFPSYFSKQNKSPTKWLLESILSCVLIFIFPSLPQRHILSSPLLAFTFPKLTVFTLNSSSSFLFKEAKVRPTSAVKVLSPGQNSYNRKIRPKRWYIKHGKKREWELNFRTWSLCNECESHLSSVCE